MTIMPVGVRNRARTILAARMHNLTTSVKKITSTTTTQKDPRYKESEQPVFTTYTDFQCSYYHMLSGKVDRMFSERDIAELTQQLGTFEQTIYAVRYISDLTLSVSSPPGGSPITNNLIIDEEVLIDSEWWKVRIVVPDSEGIQHTALVTK